MKTRGRRQIEMEGCNGQLRMPQTTDISARARRDSVGLTATREFALLRLIDRLIDRLADVPTRALIDWLICIPLLRMKTSATVGRVSGQAIMNYARRCRRHIRRCVDCMPCTT